MYWIKPVIYLLREFLQDIGLGKTKYMEVGRHRGMIANEHIMIGSNSYEKVKTFDKLKLYSGGNKM